MGSTRVDSPGSTSQRKGPTVVTDSLPSSHDTERQRVRAAVRPVAFLVLVVAVAFTALGTFPFGSAKNFSPEQHGWPEFLGVTIVVGIAIGILFGKVVPHAPNSDAAAGRALGFSIAAILLLAVFWSGLPLVFGAAGILLGYSGRLSAKSSTASIIAIALGALASLGYVAIYILDFLDSHGLL